MRRLISGLFDDDDVHVSSRERRGVEGWAHDPFFAAFSALTWFWWVMTASITLRWSYVIPRGGSMTSRSNATGRGLVVLSYS